MREDLLERLVDAVETIAERGIKIRIKHLNDSAPLHLIIGDNLEDVININVTNKEGKK